MSAPVSSGLYVGAVRHRRHRPVVNEFRYRTYHVLLDLDGLPELDRHLVGFAHNRAAVASLHDTDHLGASDLGLREKLDLWLRAQGVEPPTGRVQLLTGLRVLGHGFDPVSWWFCHHADGRLALVVAEVHNTFGDSYSYLLDRLDTRPDGTVRAQAPKVFHVSPFLGIEGLVYEFVFRPPDAARALVHMQVHDDDGVVLDATQDGRRRELTRWALVRALLRHPILPLRTIVLIHHQALRLWWKRVGFHRRPTPPHNRYPTDRAIPAGAVTQERP